MAAKSEDGWLFIAEWFDPMPQMKKQYLLKYFVDVQMVEMVDVKSKKMFLKKSKVPPEVTRADFFVGGKVVLYSRELTIVDYGDSKTRNLLEVQSQKSLVLIPSNSYTSWGNIVNDVLQRFNLAGMQTVSLQPDIADEVIRTVDENDNLVPILSKNVCLLLVVHGKNGVDELGKFCFELSDRYNCVLVTPQNPGQVNTLLTNTLSGVIQVPTACLTDSTLCLIKPHAVKAKATGQIIDQIINGGFDISAITTITFDRTTADEFLEVYKGVVPNASDYSIQLCTGMSVAIEVVGQEENTVAAFRLVIVGVLCCVCVSNRSCLTVLLSGMCLFLLL
jgi:nucleoside-diphosphate kinase